MNEYKILNQCYTKLYNIIPVQKYFITNEIPLELFEYIVSFYIPLLINDLKKPLRKPIYKKHKKSHKSYSFKRRKSHKHSFKNRRKSRTS
jgi:hypothetical protein